MICTRVATPRKPPSHHLYPVDKACAQAKTLNVTHTRHHRNYVRTHRPSNVRSSDQLPACYSPDSILYGVGKFVLITPHP